MKTTSLAAIFGLNLEWGDLLPALSVVNFLVIAGPDQVLDLDLSVPGLTIVRKDKNIINMELSITDVDLRKMVIVDIDVAIMNPKVIVMDQRTVIAMDLPASEDMACVPVFVNMDQAAAGLVPASGDVVRRNSLTVPGEDPGRDHGDPIAICIDSVAPKLVILQVIRDHAHTILKNDQPKIRTVKIAGKLNHAALGIRRNEDVVEKERKMDLTLIMIKMKMLVIQCLFKELFWKKLPGHNLFEVMM